jgi:hypothetical protein
MPLFKRKKFFFLMVRFILFIIYFCYLFLFQFDFFPPQVCSSEKQKNRIKIDFFPPLSIRITILKSLLFFFFKSDFVKFCFAVRKTIIKMRRRNRPLDSGERRAINDADLEFELEVLNEEIEYCLRWPDCPLAKILARYLVGQNPENIKKLPPNLRQFLNQQNQSSNQQQHQNQNQIIPSPLDGENHHQKVHGDDDDDEDVISDDDDQKEKVGFESSLRKIREQVESCSKKRKTSSPIIGINFFDSFALPEDFSAALSKLHTKHSWIRNIERRYENLIIRLEREIFASALSEEELFFGTNRNLTEQEEKSKYVSLIRAAITTKNQNKPRYTNSICKLVHVNSILSNQPKEMLQNFAINFWSTSNMNSSQQQQQDSRKNKKREQGKFKQFAFSHIDEDDDDEEGENVHSASSLSTSSFLAELAEEWAKYRLLSARPGHAFGVCTVPAFWKHFAHLDEFFIPVDERGKSDVPPLPNLKPRRGGVSDDVDGGGETSTSENVSQNEKKSTSGRTNLRKLLLQQDAAVSGRSIADDDDDDDENDNQDNNDNQVKEIENDEKIRKNPQKRNNNQSEISIQEQSNRLEEAFVNATISSDAAWFLPRSTIVAVGALRKEQFLASIAEAEQLKKKEQQQQQVTENEDAASASASVVPGNKNPKTRGRGRVKKENLLDDDQNNNVAVAENLIPEELQERIAKVTSNPSFVRRIEAAHRRKLIASREQQRLERDTSFFLELFWRTNSLLSEKQARERNDSLGRKNYHDDEAEEDEDNENDPLRQLLSDVSWMVNTSQDSTANYFESELAAIKNKY